MSKKTNIVSENEVLASAGIIPGVDGNRRVDDYRPLCSPLTYEQYKEAERVLEECKKDMQGAEPVGKRIYSNDPKFPYYRLFKYFQDTADGMEKDGMNSSCCIVCGEPKDRTNINCDPFCFNCYRKLRKGVLPSIDNMRNGARIAKPCRICGVKPAQVSMNGVCKTCYRRGDLIKDHSIETLTRLYQERVNRYKKPKTITLKPKNWEEI